MDWQELGKAVWAAAGPVVIVAVIAIARERVAAIKDERVRRLLEELVRAAEQVLGPKTGTEKLAYVQDELASRGLPVDTARIEGAVGAMNQAQKKPDCAPGSPASARRAEWVVRPTEPVDSGTVTTSSERMTVGYHDVSEFYQDG